VGGAKRLGAEGRRMSARILITGGAGFIGSSLARRALHAGYEVSVLDNFSPQIHGGITELPADLRHNVRLFRGDVRDSDLCAQALAGQQILVHLAAETGTGQSMYRLRHYTDVNIGATSGLMELVLTGRYPIQNLVAASSRAVYGEGAARCREHEVVYPHARMRKDMDKGDFEPKCPVCSRPTTLVPTSEDAPLRPSSLYGVTKQVQEQIILMYAATLGINGFALRYQNVYGPGQSLKNPYTGILAIFSNQVRTNEPIFVFEDGQESRDFIYVEDAVEATLRCIEAPAQEPVALNVGVGSAITVLEVARAIVAYFASNSEVNITGAFRQGDIRHSCADTARLKATLNFLPHWRFEDGLRNFLGWVSSQRLEHPRYAQSLNEMRDAGLMRG
jgi:dTDP-L-rhamnose 4-epimerase